MLLKVFSCQNPRRVAGLHRKKKRGEISESPHFLSLCFACLYQKAWRQANTDPRQPAHTKLYKPVVVLQYLRESEGPQLPFTTQVSLAATHPPLLIGSIIVYSRTKKKKNAENTEYKRFRVSLRRG